MTAIGLGSFNRSLLMFVRTDRQLFYKHITVQKRSKDDSAFTV